MRHADRMAGSGTAGGDSVNGVSGMGGMSGMGM